MKIFVFIFTLSLGSVWAANLDNFSGKIFDFSTPISTPDGLSVHGSIRFADDGTRGDSIKFYLSHTKFECLKNVTAAMMESDEGRKMLRLDINCSDISTFARIILIDLTWVTNFENFTAPVEITGIWQDINFSIRNQSSNSGCSPKHEAKD